MLESRSSNNSAGVFDSSFCGSDASADDFPTNWEEKKGSKVHLWLDDENSCDKISDLPTLHHLFVYMVCF
jgi:hypothetical protein